MTHKPFSQSLIPLGEKDATIDCFPTLHGRAPFSMALRKVLWERSYDGIVIALPDILREDFLEGIHKLPIIHGICITSHGILSSSSSVGFIPIDPCDAYVEGVRHGLQEQKPIYFIDNESYFAPPEPYFFPDPSLTEHISIESYYEQCCAHLPSPEKLMNQDPRSWERAAHNGKVLQQLSKSHNNLLFICDIPQLYILQEIYSDSLFQELEKNSESNISQIQTDVELFPINPKHLFFALKEMPFYVGEMEKERMNPFSIPASYIELLKKVLIETKREYIPPQEEDKTTSITRMQICLQYMRNLSVQQGSLTPSLFELVQATQGVFGSYFASKVVEAARDYPFVDLISDDPPAHYLQVGIEHIQRPIDPSPVEAIHYTREEPYTWKTLPLKKEPDEYKQGEYRYQWDPTGMCSHLPEDKLIEGFNQTVRRKTKESLAEHQSHSEKFTSSLKDGVDMRETLRNWHTKNVYVREIPSARRSIDTVVILFDEHNDKKYPQRTTWYAEHNQESTLSFFATDPFEKMIGPGIAQCLYGGLSLLFPPKPVSDVFQMKPPAMYPMGFKNLTQQLVYGALLNSQEREISYVAWKKPGMYLQSMAKKMKKKLIWVPMSSFSQETLRKLRRLHILNGQQVRSWASRYIPD